DIDVQFPIGALSIIAGPTGSGKSSLLSALVGEMTLVRGRVLLPTIDPNTLADSNDKYRDVIELSNEGLGIRDIAYVSQEAWLRNATIRENILFGEAYSRERYEEVLRVCALKPDLRILPAGDMSEIGERGITLSGGQKQRVALARAVYSSRRILLIDDCLSAQDSDKKNTHDVNDKKPEDDYNREHLIKLAEQKGIDPNSDLSVLQGILIKDEEREVGYVKFEVWKAFVQACGSKAYWIYIISILLLLDQALGSIYR
ncbi:hypothetical protein GGI22_002877, partial [Coemansia erecta]